MIRVLIVEDSAVTREYLCAILGEDPEIEVAGTARDGQEALEAAERLRPDVILMDVHMPRMDGIDATRQIMVHVPTPIVLTTAGLRSDETDLAFSAIKAGALTLVEKPGGIDSPETQELVRTVKLMAEVKVIRRWRAPERGSRPRAALRPGKAFRVIAFGASTGGPAALAEILGALPPARSLPPMLVVQHITPGFAAGLAEWLAKETRLDVHLAGRGEPMVPGTVLIAPDGLEMGLGAGGRIVLSAGTSNGFRPTVDHLFASVAASCGADAMGILLTGMGRDGAAGLRRLREAGSLTVAQDEATSVIFGMPGEAVRLGAAEHVLSPREIARLIHSASLGRGGGGS